MAQLKRKTLVLETDPGLDFLGHPSLTPLLLDGWQVASTEPLDGGRQIEITLLKSIRIRQQAAGTDSEIVWQGRPPFPGSIRQVSGKSGDAFN